MLTVKSKETDQLNIKRNSLFNQIHHSDNSGVLTPGRDSPDILSPNASNDNNDNDMLGNLDISGEKLIKPGLILLKTDQEALIVHSKEPIDQGNLSPKELIEKLKNDPRQKDSIYIDMGKIEEQYMRGDLMGDNEEIINDERTMKKLYTDAAIKHPCRIKNGE